MRSFLRMRGELQMLTRHAEYTPNIPYPTHRKERDEWATPTIRRYKEARCPAGGWPEDWRHSSYITYLTDEQRVVHITL